MLRLIGTDGSRYYTWTLEPGSHILGRKTECDFAVPDKTVSRRHAQIEVSSDAGQCFVTDLGSHNGTTINGKPVTDRQRVAPGDKIAFGRTEFKLSDNDETATEAAVPKQAADLSETEPERSVFLSLNEVMRPLPAKVTDLPELVPTLMDMARMLVLPEPQEVMLERSLGMLNKLIPAERLAVLLVDEDDAVTTAASIMPEGKDPGSFRLSRTIINQILEQKSSILIGDAAQDPRFARQESIILSEIQSAMAVPLLDDEKVLGILYVDTTSPMHQYNNDYLHLLATFGHVIASRMVNYALLTDRQERQVMQRELNKAAVIQENLLPTGMPTLDGFQIHAWQDQSRAVGGDLYDATMLSNGKLLALVADVSGKGMGAALLMSNILAAFRILYAESDLQLAPTVTRVSQQLHKYSAPDLFATLFIGMLNPGTNEFTFVNAGHNPPLLVRASGEMKHLEPSGTMIGAFGFGEWTEETIALEPGDLVLAFSDGVTEAERRDGEQYGDDRLEKLLMEVRENSPQQIVQTIKEDIQTFVEDAPQSDDITMLLLKREATC